jgi:hypothetical protein
MKGQSHEIFELVTWIKPYSPHSNPKAIMNSTFNSQRYSTLEAFSHNGSKRFFFGFVLWSTSPDLVPGYAPKRTFLFHALGHRIWSGSALCAQYRLWFRRKGQSTEQASDLIQVRFVVYSLHWSFSHTYITMYPHACRHVSTCTWPCIYMTYSHVSACMWLCSHESICMWAYLYVHVAVYLHVHVAVYLHVHIREISLTLVFLSPLPSLGDFPTLLDCSVRKLATKLLQFSSRLQHLGFRWPI